MDRSATNPSCALGDAAKGLAQQMVWWGCDVRHPDCNLLKKRSMERLPSPGLTGTSCYRQPWQDGIIELHGAVASWTPRPETPGALFCRDRGRIELWLGDQPPVPGRETGRHANPTERWQAFLPLARWVLDYEKWIAKTCGPQWRADCWKHIRRLPKGKPWLPPALALEWWHMASNGLPPRPKQLLRA